MEKFSLRSTVTSFGSAHTSRVKNFFMFKGLCSFIFLGPGPRSYFGSLSLTSVGLCRETTTSSFRIFVLFLRPLTVNPFSLQPTAGFIQSWFSASSLDVGLQLAHWNCYHSTDGQFHWTFTVNIMFDVLIFPAATVSLCVGKRSSTHAFSSAQKYHQTMTELFKYYKVGGFS